MTALLEVRHLSVTYPGDRRAVNDISFDIDAGETVALVGESGCGKSTTAYAIMQLLGPDARVDRNSRAVFDGDNLLTHSREAMCRIRGRRIAMIFQEPAAALNPSMRVGDQVAEVAEVHGERSHHRAFEKAVSMLERVGIRDAGRRAYAFPHELSGGMRQRVVIAMALLLQPALVIADEPTSALDVTVQAQILALIDELRRDAGTAVLFITHDLAVVAESCSRAIVMQGGSIVEQATTERLFAAPKHRHSAELLRAVPRLEVAP